jgi:hypothetical protein
MSADSEQLRSEADYLSGIFNVEVFADDDASTCRWHAANLRKQARDLVRMMPCVIDQETKVHGSADLGKTLANAASLSMSLADALESRARCIDSAEAQS